MTKPKVLTLLICAALMLSAGAAVAATNTEMEAAIAKALVEKLGSDASTIRVAYYDGKATLSGRVAELATKELAKEVALYVPGVTKVENEVESTQRREVGGGKMVDETQDANLEAAVKRAVHDEIGEHSGKVEVEACEGAVSIRGTVPDATRVGLAVAAAQKVPGVSKVVNLLRAAGG